ncbi:hypothetical protein ISN45_At01g071490 [Arabidopsis thaliana x Arabidopsis arenosa]|uniref:Uncharacterized protein n=1 Tax=Arabidopsis thaliana x Arabidopsis arenosa TaxID=1240361 RepID=A0A8T2GY44_9BRAS|nr:hypothetical protein ISN45_At01g071490 [Arabidopsis thaliana x Arabidopsis arenosa]
MMSTNAPKLSSKTSGDNFLFSNDIHTQSKRQTHAWTLLKLFTKTEIREDRELGVDELADIESRAGTSHLASERDNGEAVAVADLNHEGIRVVEEELVHLDASFFHHCSHILYLQLLELLLHCFHAFALHSTHILLSNICPY